MSLLLDAIGTSAFPPAARHQGLVVDVEGCASLLRLRTPPSGQRDSRCSSPSASLPAVVRGDCRSGP